MPRPSRRPSRLSETAEYDQDNRDLMPRTLGDRVFTDGGRADTRNRPTNPRYGDNAMADDGEADAIVKIARDDHDDGVLNEDMAESSIAQLHAMLTRADITDDRIRQGIELSGAGQHKVAARLGIAPQEVQLLINALVSKLRTEAAPLEAAYESAMREARFSYEADALGTVTVRDASTGKSAFLQGDAAADMLTRVRAHPAQEQAILGAFEPLMEATGGLDVPEEDTYTGPYADAINARAGSYNFPWRAAGMHGFAAMRYGDDPEQLQLIRVSDAEGEPFDPDPSVRRSIMRQGRAFIAEV